MSVGQGSLEGYASYLAIGRETTFGTGVTTTAEFNFLTAAMKTIKETKTIEQVETSRTYSKNFRTSKIVEGEIESYAYAEQAGFQYLLQNAFGGTITTATATSETTGGLAFTHSYVIGDMGGTYKSLSFNHRKGQSSSAQIFEYSGIRVNEANFTAEIDDALKCSFSLMAKDSTQTSNDVASALYTTTSCEPLTFVEGRISVEAGTLSDITTTSFWHVQTVEFGIANNLKGDTGSRRIGSDTLDVLPVGIAGFTLNLTMRFDTTTAYDMMLNDTDVAVQLNFEGSTLTGSNQKRGMKFNFPKVKIMDSGDPEIGGPDEQLTSQVVCMVYRDVSSAGGYAMQGEVTNLTSSY